MGGDGSDGRPRPGPDLGPERGLDVRVGRPAELVRAVDGRAAGERVRLRQHLPQRLGPGQPALQLGPGPRHDHQVAGPSAVEQPPRLLLPDPAAGQRGRDGQSESGRARLPGQLHRLPRAQHADRRHDPDGDGEHGRPDGHLGGRRREPGPDGHVEHGDELAQQSVRLEQPAAAHDRAVQPGRHPEHAGWQPLGRAEQLRPVLGGGLPGYDRQRQMPVAIADSRAVRAVRPGFGRRRADRIAGTDHPAHQVTD